MESQHKSSSQCSNIFPKGFWLFPFLSMLLTIALFLRMEAINNKTEINGMRISKVESQMKIMTTLHATDDKDVGLTQDSKKMLASIRIRRSMNSAINSSLSIEDVRREINIRISQLKPQSLCQSSKNACFPGPPGEKGSRGSRGRRGRPGDKGKKGSEGIMGPSGRHGKQGIMGSPGIKGEKGQKGAVGPRGMMGLKGDPGESISLPVAIVSPNTKTVRENHSATFYCSASGNPKPTVTWTKVKGSLRNNIAKLGHGGRLDIIHSTFNDSGEYKCIAVNMLGQDEKIVELIVEVSPRFTRVPGRFLVIEEGAVASVTCEAFSYPPSVITWTRPLVALPRGRRSVTNGTLTIQDFSAVDTGTYVCTAKNKLGSVTAVMALNIQRKPGIHYNTGFVKF
ncbi:Hemicentin-1 [Porites harrisoni]